MCVLETCRENSGWQVFYSHSLPYSSKQSLTEAIKPQPSPSSVLLPPAECWGPRLTGLHLLFTWVLRIWTQVFKCASRVLNHRAISPAWHCFRSSPGESRPSRNTFSPPTVCSFPAVCIMLEVTISKVWLASGSLVSLVKMNPSGSCKSQVGERKEAKWVEAEKWNPSKFCGQSGSTLLEFPTWHLLEGGSQLEMAQCLPSCFALKGLPHWCVGCMFCWIPKWALHEHEIKIQWAFFNPATYQTRDCHPCFFFFFSCQETAERVSKSLTAVSFSPYRILKFK